MILCFSLSLSAYSSETCLINKLKEPMSITRDVRPKVLLWKHLAHHNIKVSEVTMRFLLFFLLTLPVYASFEGSYSGAAARFLPVDEFMSAVKFLCAWRRI